MTAFFSNKSLFSNIIVFNRNVRFENLPFLDKPNRSTFSQPSDPPRFNYIKWRCQLSFFTNSRKLLVVLIHRYICKRLSLSIRQLAQILRLIDELLIFFVWGLYYILDGSFEGRPVNIPQKARCLSLNWCWARSTEQQT